MFRIGSMNMLLHGVKNPDVRYQNSLAQEHSDDKDILANLAKLEVEIQQGMEKLAALLK